MELNASLEVAMLLGAFEIFFVFCDPKAALNDWLFMQVVAAPVFNNHDFVWLPVLMFILSLTFSPGAKISNNLL